MANSSASSSWPAVFSNYISRTGEAAAIATCLFIPLSVSLMDGAAALVFVCWLLSGKVLALPALLRRQPAALLALALFALFCLGLIYTPAPLSEALPVLAKYRELLYIPAILALLENKPGTAALALYAFIAGATVLLLTSSAMYLSLLPSHKYGYSLLFHITHSYFMAFLAFAALQLALVRQGYHRLWILLAIAAVINLFYINPGRTGMAAFLILLLLTLIQHCSLKTMLASLLLGMALLGGAYYSSDNFSSRTQEAVKELQEYRPGSSRTSLGQRLDWWYNSLDLIKKAPILGLGTGSYGIEQRALVRQQKKRTQRTDNPHNEYLFIASQIGLTGLLLFLGLLAVQFRQARQLPDPNRYLLQGVVVAMAAGCLSNSFLFDSHQGHFYAVLSAALMAGGKLSRS